MCLEQNVCLFLGWIRPWMGLSPSKFYKYWGYTIISYLFRCIQYYFCFTYFRFFQSFTNIPNKRFISSRRWFWPVDLYMSIIFTDRFWLIFRYMLRTNQRGWKSTYYNYFKHQFKRCDQRFRRDGSLLGYHCGKRVN